MVNVANILRDKDTPANALKLILTHLFKDKWITWEIETVLQEISRLYNIKLPSVNRGKLQALRAIATTEDFQLSGAVFENIVTAINGHEFDPLELQICSPEEIAYAVSVADVSPSDFGREVIGYIRVCMKQEGLIRYPKAVHGLEDGDKALIAKIKPSLVAPTEEEESDVVKVQSFKLGQIEMAVYDRLNRFASKLTK